MLEDLLNGTEPSRLVIITDEADCPGRHLLLNWIRSLAARYDQVILVCYERHPDFYRDWLPTLIQKKLVIISNKSQVQIPGRAHDALLKAEETVAQVAGSVAVLIDSLSVYLLETSIPVTCQVLHKIATGGRVSQMVALLHKDVHSQQTHNLVQHVAPTVLALVSVTGSKYTCCVRHSRSTGKVLRSTEYFIINERFEVSTFGNQQMTENVPDSTLMEPVDITANLPFNVSLTDWEKDARSKVRLPYLKDGIGDRQSPSESKIVYHPDKDDDFDEEDPDNDLNI